MDGEGNSNLMHPDPITVLGSPRRGLDLADDVVSWSQSRDGLACLRCLACLRHTLVGPAPLYAIGLRVLPRGRSPESLTAPRPDSC